MTIKRFGANGVEYISGKQEIAEGKQVLDGKALHEAKPILDAEPVIEKVIDGPEKIDEGKVLTETNKKKGK